MICMFDLLLYLGPVVLLLILKPSPECHEFFLQNMTQSQYKNN